MNDCSTEEGLWASIPSARTATRFVEIVFESSPTGMALIDERGLHLAVNPALSTVLGQPMESLVESSCWHGIHPDDVDADRRGMHRLLSGEVASYEVEERVIGADGRHRWVEVTVSGMLGPELGEGVEARLLRQVRSIQDIADQRAADRQIRAALDALEVRAADLAAANGRLADLAATLSHDLLQPVAALDGFLRLLQSSAGELEEEHRSWLERAIASKDRLTEAIRSLHRHAALEELSLIEVDLGVLVRRELTELTLLRPDVEIDVGELPTVLGDPGLLQQVLANLVENALRYRSPERPLRLSVRACRDGDDWEITFSDTGLGITPGQLEAVFERGFRGTASTDTMGSGVGLATVRSLVERLGGTVVALPRRDGACISVTLRAVS
jgi:PAS domain S-box-containing protein